MRDINDIMPKIPGMKLGVVSDQPISFAKMKELIKVMPLDSKWHTLFETPGAVHIDGKTVLRKTAERLT